MKKLIYADYDDEGVYLYQAFKPEIVKVAVELQTFGKGFGLDRITWIKPSFGWILRRSKYATKNRMQAIARIKITHEAFLEILEQSIITHWDSEIYPSEDTWKKQLDNSDVIHQWDPERDIIGKRLDRQAIQIGIRGEVIKKYVSEYIISVEDVTPLAHKLGELKKKYSRHFPKLPEEKEYEIPEELFKKLGCTK
ncbi:DUF4291 family protein [Aureivirga sp. CE67]|uniref:DUF4291 family protein n=1 Tax=Aureivirga sp. CE67 TaxID=1788983 RepID=UPI0018C9BE14|nr:DUF4291 family protein [Aureivirga sp. CE67]